MNSLEGQHLKECLSFNSFLLARTCYIL